VAAEVRSAVVAAAIEASGSATAGSEGKNYIQLLKKLSQCFAILERVTWNKSNKLSDIVKIMYVILHYLGFRKYPGSCDLDQK